MPIRGLVCGKLKRLMKPRGVFEPIAGWMVGKSAVCRRVFLGMGTWFSRFSPGEIETVEKSLRGVTPCRYPPLVPESTDTGVL